MDKGRKHQSLVAEKLWQIGASTGELIVITIGTMGMILEGSHKSSTRLGIVNQCNSLQMIAMNSSIIMINAVFYHLALWLKNVTEQTSFLQTYMIFNSSINNPKTRQCKEDLYLHQNGTTT